MMKLPGCQFIVAFKGIIYEDVVGIGQLLWRSHSWSIDDTSSLTVLLQQKTQGSLRNEHSLFFQVSLDLSQSVTIF